MMFPLSWTALWLFFLSALFTNISYAATDSDGLKDLQPLEVPKASLADIAQRYPQFKHVPFAESGINPLILPFRDETGDATTVSEESLALSFLVSWDLDYIPENFCSRHAYFIFKRSEKACRALLRRYDARIISWLMKGWHSTHAVGGGIRKTDKGYTGSVVVYSPDGNIIGSETFDNPRPYHELLGDISITAMKIMGVTPRQTVVEYLHKPRFKKEESLTLLGQAAFVQERSDAEFDLYRKILDIDPGFAEVRYWLANQSRWKNNDSRIDPQELERTLEERLLPPALTIYNLSTKSNIEIKTKYYRWIDQAVELLGDDSPTLLQMHLTQASTLSEPKPGLMEEALTTAGKFPNIGDLLHDTAHAAAYHPGRFNKGLSASIYLSIPQSRFIPANGFIAARHGAISAMTYMGRIVDALQTIQTFEKGEYDPASPYVVSALTQAGYFQQILQMYNDNKELVFNDSDMLHAVAMCASLRGDAPTLRDVITKYQPHFETMRTLVHFQAYLRELEHPDQPMVYDIRNFQKLNVHKLSDMMVLYCNRDLEAHGGSQHQKLAVLAATWNPCNRLAWMIADQYYRKRPGGNYNLFYDGLDFLYGDDPWVKSAVARWQKLKIPPARLQIENHALIKDDAAVAQMTRQKSEEFARSVQPWAVAGRVQNLLEQGERQQALSLASRYLDAALRSHADPLIIFARQIREKAEQYRVN